MLLSWIHLWRLRYLSSGKDVFRYSRILSGITNSQFLFRNESKIGNGTGITCPYRPDPKPNVTKPQTHEHTNSVRWSAITNFRRFHFKWLLFQKKKEKKSMHYVIEWAFAYGVPVPIYHFISFLFLHIFISLVRLIITVNFVHIVYESELDYEFRLFLSTSRPTARSLPYSLLLRRYSSFFLSSVGSLSSSQFTHNTLISGHPRFCVWHRRPEPIHPNYMR